MTEVVLKPTALEAVEGLKGWEFFLEVEYGVQTRDTIGRAGAWRIHAPVNDHLPAHVHARKDADVVTIYLDSLEWKRKSGKPKPHEVRDMLRDFEPQVDFFRRQHDNVRGKAVA